jgi:hypothetical protein
MIVSTFKTVSDPNPASASLESILRGIQEGRWQDLVLPVATEKNKKKRAALKKKLPSFTPSGTFKSNTDSSLNQHSGFIAMDFDEPGPDFPALIAADKYTWAMFRSVSQNGFCVIVRIDPARHEESFYALADYYRSQYHENADPSCSNVSRKRFISYDPNLFLNENSKLFQLPKSKPRKPDPVPLQPFVESDFERLVQAIVTAGKDLTGTYHEWINCGLACRQYNSGSLGLELFKSISRFHPGYSPGQCEKKWRQLPQPHTVSINYLFAAAARQGITIQNPLASQVANIAQVARASGKTIKQAIEAVQNRVGEAMTPEYHKLASNSFNTNQPPSPRQAIHMARLYLQLNCNLWECEITRRVYDGQSEVTERYLNQLWEQINNSSIQITADSLSRLVYNNQNPKRNALKEWFTEIRCDGVEAIDSLVNSLYLSDPFGYTLIHKWLLSVINNVFNTRSAPYMLVLCGKQNTGKTSWFRGLLPENMRHWYAESKLEAGKDDLRLLTERLIVSNDEFSGKTIKEASMYKDILSKDTFTFRVPYGRTNEQFKRIASLAGTSNPTDIVTDLTGNRRIFPVEVTDTVNWQVYNAVDRNRFWGQLYNLFCEHYPWELTISEIQQLNQYSDRYTEIYIEEDMIRRLLQPDDSCRGMTTTEILFAFETQTKSRLGTKKISLAMQKNGYTQIIKKVNNKSLRAWNCRLTHSPQLPY